MAKVLTPAQVAEKHARRTKASLEDLRAGVESVTQAPGQKAAAKQNKLVQNWNEAITSGRWAKNTAAVTLDEWKSKMIDKGLSRVGPGLDAAQAKVEAFYAELLPFQQSLSSKVSAMPDLTIEDSVARSSEWIRGMAKFRKSAKTR